jgi:hypothetical protein
MGDHYTAFNIRIGSKEFNKAYSKMRYVKANFAGLVSKIVADMLFSEPIQIKVEDGDQEWVDAFVHDNKLDALFYESALSNSFLGDQVFKLRIGKRTAGDADNSIIMSNCPPSIYFPAINPFNIDEDPETKELAWTVEVPQKDGKVKKYLRKEIHKPQFIYNEIYVMEGDVIKGQTTFATVGMPEIMDIEETKIDRQLIVHSPNWKTSSRFWGISDYYDLDNLFYAINNRLSKIDNILDKHSDPLLFVPPGILDEKGNVKKGNLGVVEIQNTDEGKPEYVVWDASLENAFGEVDKLVEMLMLTSETSPDAWGMGKGLSDSGRALKLKLLRTIAKTARKKLYYNNAIKEIIYRAQLLGKAWGIPFGGNTLQNEPVMPELIWSDGLPTDMTEEVDITTKRIDNGTMSAKDAIMALDGVDEDIAKAKVKEIADEKAINLPTPNFGANPFLKTNDIAGGKPQDVIDELKKRAMAGVNVDTKIGGK